MLLAIGVLPPLLLAAHWDAIRTWEPFGIHAFVGTSDMDVYFRESRWVAGGPALYSGLPSEYPLLANILFAIVRVVSDGWHPQATAMVSYEATWVALGWWMWLAVLYVLWRNAPRRAVWLWLTPASLYFTLFRFDAFPVACTLVALLAAREGRLRWAALALGVAIGLKGYALFAVPAFAVWIWKNRGWREATVDATLAVAPLAISMVVVLALGGVTAMLYPFRWQAIRGPNGQSTWDMVALLTRGLGTSIVRHLPLLPFVLQVASGLVAAALRPRTFEQFLRAFVVAIGGFVTFSVFYSPQFALWFVPPVALSESLALVLSAIALQWVTIVYFPLAYYSHVRGLFRGVMLLVTAIRTVTIAIALIPAGFISGRRPQSLAGDAKIGAIAEDSGKAEGMT